MQSDCLKLNFITLGLGYIFVMTRTLNPAVLITKGPKIALVKLPKLPNADEIEENRVLSELFGSLWLMKSRVSACLDLKNRR